MDQIQGDACPVAVAGIDPRIDASFQIGMDIVERNLLRMEKLLKDELTGITLEKRTMDYHHVKNLLSNGNIGMAP